MTETRGSCAEVEVRASTLSNGLAGVEEVACECSDDKARRAGKGIE